MRKPRKEQWRLEAGHVLGSWRVVEPLGRGGMGEVYVAEHVLIEDRSAALKILQPHRALDDTFRARFFEEVAVQAKIDSPNVVRLYDANVTEGVAWMALELLRGEPLDDVLREQGTLSHTDALRVVSEVADGVHAIHAIGALHRDLKPANVFVTEASEIKVLDLGTTKIVGGDVKRCRPSTDVGSVIGTFTYVAPEQLLGERVDLRCDIYALGVLAYVVMTGHHPFEGQDGSMNMQALAFRAATAEPLPIVRFAPSCPEEVWKFLTTLLAKNPDHRPPSMAHVASEARVLRTRLLRTGERETSPEATTTAATSRTPGGTVRMRPVPEEVNAYLERHRAPAERAACADGQPDEPAPRHGTLPMTDVPPEVVERRAARAPAQPGSQPRYEADSKPDSGPVGAAELEHQTPPGTSRSLAMARAPEPTAPSRARALPRRVLAAVAVAVTFAAGAVVYRVGTGAASGESPATASSASQPVMEEAAEASPPLPVPAPETAPEPSEANEPTAAASAASASPPAHSKPAPTTSAATSSPPPTPRPQPRQPAPTATPSDVPFPIQL